MNRHIIFCLALTGLLLCSSISSLIAQNPLSKHNTINKVLTPGKFSSLTINGNCEVVLYDADDNSVMLETVPEDLDYIHIYCTDDILTIRTDDNINSRPVINVYIDKLYNIVAHGDVTVNCAINLTPDDLRLYADYNSEINLFLSSTDIDIMAVGTGQIYIEGDVKNLKVSTHEEISMKCNLISNSVIADIHNLSSIIIKGNVQFIKANVVDEGFLKAFDANTNDAKIKVKDDGYVQIYVSGTASIQSKDNSGVIIKGKPKKLIENNEEQ